MERPSAPRWSKVPCARVFVSGTATRVSTMARTPRPHGTEEEGVPVGVLRDRGGERQRESTADAYGRAHQGHGGAEAFAGQFVAHQADAQRDRAHGEALEGTADDHREERAGESADQRADHHHGQAGEQHAALAVEVAETAHDRGGHGAGQQGGGQYPGRVAGRGVQQLREVLDHRDQQGLHHRDDDSREGQHRDDRSGGGCGPCGSLGGPIGRRWCVRLRH